MKQQFIIAEAQITNSKRAAWFSFGAAVIAAIGSIISAAIAINGQ